MCFTSIQFPSAWPWSFFLISLLLISNLESTPTPPSLPIRQHKQSHVLIACVSSGNASWDFRSCVYNILRWHWTPLGLTVHTPTNVGGRLRGCDHHRMSTVSESGCNTSSYAWSRSIFSIYFVMIAFYTEWLGIRDIKASILAKRVTSYVANDHDAEIKSWLARTFRSASWYRVSNQRLILRIFSMLTIIVINFVLTNSHVDTYYACSTSISILWGYVQCYWLWVHKVDNTSSSLECIISLIGILYNIKYSVVGKKNTALNTIQVKYT